MKIIQFGKNYRSITRYFLGAKGSIEQMTSIYDTKVGNRVQTVFATKHCKVKVTSTGLVIRYLFNRNKMSTRVMQQCVRKEEPVVFAFLNSNIGQQSIKLAEKVLLESNGEEGGEL